MEAGHAVDSFGGAEDVLFAQEVKLEELQGENRVLGAAVEALQDKLRAAEGRAAAATKRAADAEAKLHAKAAGASADAERLAAAQEEVQRLKHQLHNERVLMAERRRGAEQAAAAEAQTVQRLQGEAAQLRSSNAQLQQQLAAANVQRRQLESLQPFADSWAEQRDAAQQRERSLSAALDAANARAQQLDGRCASLEREVASTVAALQAAQQLADSRATQQQPPQQVAEEQKTQRRQRRAGSLSLSDLCDLEGVVSQFDGGGGNEGGDLAACSHEQLEQLLGEVLEYSERAQELVAANTALVQEKRGWLDKLAAAEAEAERYRGEAQQLRLRLLPSAADEQVLQAVAAEAALRSLLLEARQELMSACRALSGELHRVHKLEELRIRVLRVGWGDVAEVRRLHLQLHEARQDCHKLAKALAVAQQQLAAGNKRAVPELAGGDWRIAALGSSSRAE
ncbi:hypothetical protein COHA_006068 [Chlorella ohadii]|uniref:Uncharacterized protein n=1 Tax=Chlorella ohadii TaxID=2649997 RepID=A0AAD5DQA4_9CHLO|nr:hypothetical protein COHA_006068 [Chlorella ohadii]